ncbi:MAG: transglycosylase SLT domain-containing protein, partial [Gemmatimonadota bacterium]
LTHLSGSLTGTTSFESADLIKVGRAQDCDLRYDSRQDARVSGHHAHIVLQQGAYHLIDAGSTNGTMVNGQRVVKHQLATGDRIVFGHPAGPEVLVEIELAPRRGRETSEKIPTEFAMVDPRVLDSYNARQDAQRMASELKSDLGDSSANLLVSEAAQRVAEARARAGKEHSGHSMFIMAGVFSQVSRKVREKTRKKWVKVVAIVAVCATVSIAALGVIIVLQHRQISHLVQTKADIDREILAVEQQMEDERDPGRLVELESILAILTGSAERTVARLIQTDSVKAVALTRGDSLEGDIRGILAKFSATTYAIPPIFRERLQYHIDLLTRAGNLRTIYARKQRFWPVIRKEFDLLGLPEEMAFVAWAESQFDPEALSDAGARGMWQMTPSTAQSLGLRVDDQVDERTDVGRQTHAAARHLANLLSEFGEDSFMLAMASYNRGEAGIRRVLHEVAAEQGGFRKDKRDFWHLYRLKKLPEETREYVPRILAAAIVCGHPERYGLGGAAQ